MIPPPDTHRFFFPGPKEKKNNVWDNKVYRDDGTENTCRRMVERQVPRQPSALGGRGSPAEGGGLLAEALSPLITAAFASSCSLSIIPLGSLHGIYLKFNHFNI